MANFGEDIKPFSTDNIKPIPEYKICTNQERLIRVITKYKGTNKVVICLLVCVSFILTSWENGKTEVAQELQ